MSDAWVSQATELINATPSANDEMMSVGGLSAQPFTSGAGGLFTITFKHAQRAKPKLFVTPESVGGVPAITSLENWTTDASGHFITVDVRVKDHANANVNTSVWVGFMRNFNV
jgi:hypothetical protein